MSTAKFVLMLITVSAFCAAAPAQTAGDGPILSLAGYQWYPDAPESAAISALPEGGPRGGQAVAFPVVPRQSCPLLSEALPVEPGRAFTFSAQVKPDIHNGRGDLLVVFLREKDDREDLLAVDSVTFAGKGGWRSVTVNTVSPPEARFVRLRMNVEGSEDARGTVMFADVSFVPSVGVSLLFPDGINVAAPGDAPEVSLHLYGARDGWRFDAAAQVFDVDGNPIEGAQIKWRDITGGEQPWQLPAFGPGHYTIEIEVARAETEGQPIRKRIGFAVLSALDTVPSADTSIALDAGMSWEYATEPDRLERACRLVERLGIRMCRDRLSWHGVEEEPGVFDWGRYGVAAKAQQRHGIDVYHVFHDAPAWSVPPAAQDSPRPYAHAPEDPMAVYRFVNRFVRGLGGAVRCLEIWNEADHTFFYGRPEDYVAMLKAAYLGAKDADPAFGVLIGSETRIADPFYFDVYESGVGRYFDINNTHYYQDPERVIRHVRELRRRTAPHGLDGKPIWITEIGRSIPTTPGTDIRQKEWEQSSYLLRTYACARAAGVSRYFCFYLAQLVERDGSKWGILDDALTPRPSYVTLGVMLRQLGAAECLGWSEDDGRYRVAFRKGGEEAVLVAWSTSPDSMTLANGLSAVDLVGRSIKPDDTGAITLDTAPVFINGLTVEDVAALQLDSPAPAPAWAPESDPDLASKRVWLQLGVNPEQPRPTDYGIITKEKGGALIEGGEVFTVAAWANNYSDAPAKVAVQCEDVPEGLRLKSRKKRSATVEPWGRERIDFKFAGKGLIKGQRLRIPFSLECATGRDEASVYVQARTTDKPPRRTATVWQSGGDPGLWQMHHSPNIEATIAADAQTPHAGVPSVFIDIAVTGRHESSWAGSTLTVPAGIDPGKFQGIEVDSYAAAGVPETGRIMVDVKEKSGGTWRLGELRGKREGGWRTQFFLFEAAQRMAWVDDDNNRLDVDSIKSVSFTWSGYESPVGTGVQFRLGGIRALGW